MFALLRDKIARWLEDAEPEYLTLVLCVVLSSLTMFIVLIDLLFHFIFLIF